MRVAVFGAYGVFGTRLVQLLVRDGHQVIVIGRNPDAAMQTAQAFGAQPLALDRGGDLGPLWAQVPDAVVDAAGPFHAYGSDPYRLPRACVAQGVHYLDLADDAAFCAGITCLDAEARAAGVFVFSGASSVPAISSAAVAALAKGASEVDSISSAILPGNRAPRGASVVRSILHQCGRPMRAPVDGVVMTQRSWSDPVHFDLGRGLRRQGWFIAVPDQRLFADAFAARTVTFRAGLELGVMNRALALFSKFRGRWGGGVPDWLVRLVLFLSKMLWPLGTDRGGMVVEVVVRANGHWQRRTWRMIVGAGDGPFIPAVPARVMLRHHRDLKPGARPAVCAVPLEQLTDGMADLAMESEMVEESIVPVFPAFLGPDFDELPPQVQAAHDVPAQRRWAGRAKVTRGTSLWARMIAAVFGFPPATADSPVIVTMTPGDGGETWERQFGARRFKSFLKVQNGAMTERFGPLTFTLDLHVSEGRLHFPVKTGRLGPVPLPRVMLPISEACEFEADGRFHFDVALRAPISGALMVHYQGWLVRAEDATEALQG